MPSGWKPGATQTKPTFVGLLYASSYKNGMSLKIIII